MFMDDNIIINVALYLSIEDIPALCLTCNRWTHLVDSNEYFWQLKFLHDYQPVEMTPGCWQLLYQAYTDAI